MVFQSYKINSYKFFYPAFLFTLILQNHLFFYIIQNENNKGKISTPGFNVCVLFPIENLYKETKGYTVVMGQTKIQVYTDRPYHKLWYHSKHLGVKIF